MVPHRMWPRSRFVSTDRSRGAKRRGAVKLRLIVVVLLLAGFVAAAVLASVWVDTENPKTLDKKMREAFDKQKYADTEKYARRLLAMDPKSTGALLFAGQALIREERPLEALK